MRPSARDGDIHSRWPGWWTTLAFGPAYLAAAELGHAVSLEPGHFATFWPPAGLLLVALILAPARRWPGLILMAVLANVASDVLFHGRTLPVGLGFTAANVLEGILGAVLVGRIRGPDFQLTGLADVLGLVVAALAATAVGATAGIAVSALAFGDDPWAAWPTWWLADLTGALVFAPLVLAWADLEAWPTARRTVEKAVLLAGVVGMTLFIFRGGSGVPITPAFILPLMLWAAVRFQFRGVGLAMAGFAVVAIGHTAVGIGPATFAPVAPARQVLVIQAVVALFAICGLALAALTAERERASAALREVNRGLEARVHDRTAELRVSEERYRAFIAASTEGVWRLEFDPPIDVTLPPDEQIDRVYRDGRFAECNDAFARMYGYDRAEQMVGLGLAVMLPPDDPDVRAYLRSVIAAGYRANDVESTERDRYGHTVYFANGLAGEVRDGRLLRVWGTQRDVTARRKAEDELRESGRRKDEFLATLAHELRNPLAPVRNALQVLERAGDDRATIARFRGLMDRQIAHMVRLIDDLLDLARVTRGLIVLRTARLDAADAVRAAVESSRPALEAGGHVLAVDLPTDPVEVDGDLTRLAQVVANLLDNAAKYTPAGGHVRVALAAEGNEAVVRVTDDGAGIPPDMLPHVWDMFAQVNRRLDRAQGGLGIGLALVKRLVELHHGSVEVYSGGAGTGATFAVRLPLSRPEARAAPPAEHAPAVCPPPAASRLRVLVVDDNHDSADSLAELVAAYGHEPRVAYDGPSALKAADAFCPAVVLLDIGMPEMSGYEVAARLRQAPAGRSAVLVAQTGWGQDHDRRKSHEAGFDHHLTKPIDPAVLQAILATAGGGLFPPPLWGRVRVGGGAER